jgi:hypothetical protein
MLSKLIRPVNILEIGTYMAILPLLVRRNEEVHCIL